jgi:hypothetical protein
VYRIPGSRQGEFDLNEDAWRVALGSSLYRTVGQKIKGMTGGRLRQVIGGLRLFRGLAGQFDGFSSHRTARLM